jgi:AraC-like DNA-binding protein
VCDGGGSSPHRLHGCDQEALRRLLNLGISLRRLAWEAGVSERQFRRACVARTGIPPQYLGRILRFRSAADGIRRLRNEGIARLAVLYNPKRGTET